MTTVARSCWDSESLGYVLVPDLRSAKALGLSVAPSLLARTDEVIE
jgi:hypothetical protein